MKGRNYTPCSGIETHVEWHWNDGAYTYGNQDNLDTNQRKPWETVPDAPVR
jgi:hypothetical protein